MTFEIHTLFDDVCFVDLRNATDHVPQRINDYFRQTFSKVLMQIYLRNRIP